MSNYRAMYYRLQGKVADAIDMLVEAQRESEEVAMEDAAAIHRTDLSDEQQEKADFCRKRHSRCFGKIELALCGRGIYTNYV